MSGDYISREYLGLTDFEIIMCNGDYKAGLKMLLEKIESAPAADVKPVIHAHFYVDEGCAYCSNCRNNFKKAILKAVKYCPNCGAKMDGDRE